MKYYRRSTSDIQLDKYARDLFRVKAGMGDDESVWQIASKNPARCISCLKITALRRVLLLL